MNPVTPLSQAAQERQSTALNAASNNSLPIIDKLLKDPKVEDNVELWAKAAATAGHVALVKTLHKHFFTVHRVYSTSCDPDILLAKMAHSVKEMSNRLKL